MCVCTESPVATPSNAAVMASPVMEEWQNSGLLRGFLFGLFNSCCFVYMLCKCCVYVYVFVWILLHDCTLV